MKKTIFLILAAILIATLLFAGKSFSGGSIIEIKDVTKEQIITLAELEKPKGVHSIRIEITGHIDGSATIQRAYEDKKMYGPEIISGNVNLHLGGDWYGDKCLIIYKPSGVTAGSLKIRYKFGTI